MSQDDTKQKILDVSLDLFSRRGYAAVSVRDICKPVGIRESSVYYHFKNKHAILNTLREQFETAAGELMGELGSALEGPLSPNPGWTQSISNPFFERYLMDEFCNKFMRVLTIEQGSGEEFRNLYHKWLFDEPLQFQSRVFSLLAEQKITKTADSAYLAVKFYSPILLFFQRFLLNGDLTQDRKTLFLQKANAHINSFFQENLEVMGS